MNLQIDDEEDDESVYTHLGGGDEEYDTILTSSGSPVIANRPPAPTPRPNSFINTGDNTPFIAQGLTFQRQQIKFFTSGSINIGVLFLPLKSISSIPKPVSRCN